MKRISLFVIGMHITLLLWMALWMPVKKERKQPIQVRTIHEEVPLKKKPQPKKVVNAVKKQSPIIKQPVVEKPKAPIIPDVLIHQLEESIAKIEEKSHKEVPKLEINEALDGEEDTYVRNLVQYLQNVLELPEVGAVKLELTLKCDGTFVKMRILESASNRNQKFLETQLRSLKFPAFSDFLKKEKEHIFVITFCNY